MSDQPWRERLELGLAIKDEMGPNWIALEGEDFFEKIESAVSLTEQLSADWVAVFCHLGKEDRSFSGTEIAATLKLDHADAIRCLRHLEDEGLVEGGVLSGTYRLATGERSTQPGCRQRQMP